MQVKSGESVDISLTVKNVGKVTGEEIVQLYVHDEIASIPRPFKELKGYQRIKLEPGEFKKIVFHLPVNQLAFYDLDLNLSIEAGKIKVLVGSSSGDIRLRGEFVVLDNKRLTVNERVFVCPVTVV
jgi:beta-glucosidase